MVILCGLVVYTYAPRGEQPSPLASAEFHFFGTEAETVVDAEATERQRVQAEAALQDADFHGAFAAGPSGRTGLWTGAHTLARARDNALAICRAGCRIVAERVPPHRQDVPGDTDLNTEMTRHLGNAWPFTGGEVVARGGANAWDYDPGGWAGRGQRRAGERDALGECERRRAAEATPEGAVSPPCVGIFITDFHDERPRPETHFPAAFEVAPIPLTPIQDTRVIWRVPPRWLVLIRPDRLHGAIAEVSGGAFGYVDEAGWPEVGDQMALIPCELARDYGEDACCVGRSRDPATPVPEGTAAVDMAAWEAYQWWLGTSGAGAFAIGPTGSWDYSREFATLDEALQRAADRCDYNTRRTRDRWRIHRTFTPLPAPCRIVAFRTPDGTTTPPAAPPDR